MITQAPGHRLWPGEWWKAAELVQQEIITPAEIRTTLRKIQRAKRLASNHRLRVAQNPAQFPTIQPRSIPQHQ
jgi:hypothetical protein